MAFAKTEVKKEYYNNQAPKQNQRWWKVPKTELATEVFAEVNRIKKSQALRSNRLSFLSQLYQNEDISPFRDGYYIPDTLGSSTRPTFNVIKSNTDTLTSKIGTKRPKPVFLTKRGNWALQRKAKNLTKYIEGVFQTGNAWTEGTIAFRDSCITGTGFLQISISLLKKMIMFERVHESEVIVDEYESLYGNPPQMFRAYWEQKDALKDRYPKLEMEIDSAATQATPKGSTVAAWQMVQVIQAWRPKSDISKGRWCKVISNAVLEEKEYAYDYYPFVKVPYTRKLFGYFGLSMGEDILGIQLDINKTLRTISRAQHLMSVPQVWLDIQSKKITSKLTNRIGAERFYKGVPPIFLVPQAMSGEVYSHLENLVQKSYQLTGVSQLSAQGKKPAGVDARVALRELQDIESERFQTTEATFDQMFLASIPIVTDLTDELQEIDGNLMVKVAGKHEMEMISWKNVKMDINQYIYQIFPSSLLPSSPTGRLQYVQELMQSGIYDRETAVSLLDFPDTEAANSMITATRDSILRIIADIEDEKGYDPPEPEINLEYARALATNAYVSDRNNGAPAAVLEDILGLIADLDGLMKKRDDAAMRKAQEQQARMQQQQAASAPPQPGAEAMPEDLSAVAKPEGQPVSELMAIA